MNRAWEKIDRPLSYLEDSIVVVLLSGVVFISFGQVVARQFDSAFMWADELVSFLVMWLGAFGAVVATRNGKHIAIDAILQLIPDKVRGGVERIIDIAAFITTIFLGYSLHLYAPFLEDEKVMTLNTSLQKLIIPVYVAIVMMAFRFIVQAILGRSHTEDGAAV